MSQWADRIAAWQVGTDQDDTTRPDELDNDSIVPEISTDLPETETTPEIATEPPSPISLLTDRMVTPREQPGLLVRNPAANGAAVAFLANGKQVALKPGESKFIGDEKQHTIRFHRGRSFGIARHILSNGEYYFAVTTNGWTLLEDETRNAH